MHTRERAIEPTFDNRKWPNAPHFRSEACFDWFHASSSSSPWGWFNPQHKFTHCNVHWRTSISSWLNYITRVPCISRRVLPHDVAELWTWYLRDSRAASMCVRLRRWGKMCCAVMKKIWDSSETTTRKSGIGGDFFEQQKLAWRSYFFFVCCMSNGTCAPQKNYRKSSKMSGGLCFGVVFACLALILRESSSSSLNYIREIPLFCDNYSSIWRPSSQFDLSPLSTMVDRLWRSSWGEFYWFVTWRRLRTCRSFARPDDIISHLFQGVFASESQQSSWENLRSRFFPLLHLDKWLKVRFRRAILSRMIFGRFVSNF